MSQSLRVALIDWNQDVRFARRAILDATPGLDVVFESDGNPSQLKQLSDLLVDVIVIDQQLEQSSGVNAFMTLRGLYEELADIPKAVLTSTFDLENLRQQCLASGMHNLVSVEAGPEGLIGAIHAAWSSKQVADLEGLVALAKATKPQTKGDFSFTQAVNALPIRKRSLVDKLAKDWKAIASGSKSKFSIELLEPLALPLGCLTTSELVFKLLQNGFLDVE
jgi:DNA-binding NarL/FixJ family response regulator